jgi:hypothetical protein
VGIANASLNRWGIAVRKGQKFEGRLYAKNISCTGKAFVTLESADGKKEYARYRIDGLSKKWKRHTFTLTSNADDSKARMAIYIDAPGAVNIDQVTLLTTGKERFKGLPYRNDISQAMVEQGLTFLRYGGTMINANEYRFKKMIGDVDKRPPYRGHWYKYSTNGFGIEDFLKFCEAAGFTPSFAMNIYETPEDAADMIEYLNGSTKTKWGKIRANAYDMVINGVVVGGGSIRIHDRDLQNKMFHTLGFSDEEAQNQFGFLMNAFEYGAPPHGGLAFGFDRMCAVFSGVDSIRDFIAFPKNNSGRDVMSGSPSPIAQAQLDELNIELKGI